MEFTATQKFLIMGPKKIRLVVDMARKMTPREAVEKLPFSGKKAAEPFIKVVKSAIANAKAKGVSEEGLTFKEIQVNEGPRLKRGRPVSRGMWHPIKKRMSHIRVVLVSKEVPKEIKKQEVSIEGKKKGEK